MARLAGPLWASFAFTSADADVGRSRSYHTYLLFGPAALVVFFAFIGVWMVSARLVLHESQRDEVVEEESQRLLDDSSVNLDTSENGET